MENIGLDIGFGDVKFVSATAINKFPTAVTHASEGGINLGSFGEATKRYLYNNNEYIIGEKAVMTALPMMNIQVLLRHAALFVAYTRNVVDFDRIAIGLPVGYYQKSSELKERLSSFTVDGSQQTYEVHVLPQGLGVLYDYILDNNGNVTNSLSDCVIVDIGFNTVDIIVYSRGKVARDDARMFEGYGVCQITSELSKLLNTRYNDTVSDQEAKEILKTRVYRSYGSRINLQDDISKICRNYAERLIAEITQKFDYVLKRTGKMLIAGGGAYFIKDNIPAKYSRMVEVVRDNGPEYANAAGFYKYLRALDGATDVNRK